MTDLPELTAADLDVTRPRLADYCRRCNKLCKGNPHTRFYCPQCHEVSCGMKRQGEWIVLPHYRRDPDGATAISRTPCHGGRIDPKEDRAP